jgi:murein DD-endopeptidase MepM/ murein hydrolase activator NlpD
MAVLCVLAFASAPAAHARSSNANTAALQLALRALRHYTGGIDGIPGRRTKRAIRRFQRSHHLHADGVAGARTRRALGRRGRPLLGHRLLRRGNHGWDVAALQFMLRRTGYAVRVDGGFGAVTQRAVRQFQARRGIHVDGRVGGQTLRAFRHRRVTHHYGGGGGGSPTGPVRFLRPVHGAMGDGFGFVSGRNHTGIDFPEPLGTPVGAAGRGTVTFAGWNSGGYGNLMIVRHRLGYETWYAHLSGFSVSTGASVAGGVRIASVGSTGRSTGPHLHFEVRHNGVPINPAPYLLGATSLRPFDRTADPLGLDCAPTPRVRDYAAGYEDDPRRTVLEPCGSHR